MADNELRPSDDSHDGAGSCSLALDQALASIAAICTPLLTKEESFLTDSTSLAKKCSHALVPEQADKIQEAPSKQAQPAREARLLRWPHQQLP